MSHVRQPDLLDHTHIQSALTPQARALLGELDLHDQIDSTNAEAMRRIEQGHHHGLVISAEQQTAGRGRRGRHWVSPHGSNIYLSAVWAFQRGAEAMSGLSLAVGVAVADALEAEGLGGIKLKWPNDILVDGAKLGGILIETVGTEAGQASAVIGVGINLQMSDSAAEQIDQRWTDAHRAGGIGSGRNQLLGGLLNHLLPLLAQFEAEGFGPWRERWMDRNAHAGVQVTLSSGDSAVAGVVRGVDDSGALLLDVGGMVSPYTGGELSLRPSQ